MLAPRSTAWLRTSRLRSTATAALATAGVAALAFTVVPSATGSPASSVDAQNGRTVGWDVKAADLPGQRQPADPRPAEAGTRVELAPASESLLADAVAGQRTAVRNAEREAAGQAAAEQRAAEARAAEVASRSAERAAPAAEPAPRSAPAPVVETPAAEPVEAAPVYTDDLDGWIREALDIMAAKGIPGTYEGLHRNIIRESSGDPNAINLWDINAINGTPSIGLLQVIQPTFDAYHVEGTPYDIYDPVANLTAAANYAADRYGSIDNVWGPY
jgi:hypothetical protein